jgi:hypothetical protein
VAHGRRFRIEALQDAKRAAVPVVQPGAFAFAAVVEIESAVPAHGGSWRSREV